jgi:hypothetical protein
MSEFKLAWTDDLVLEFLNRYGNYSAFENWKSRVDSFKREKQPKPEWEILDGIHPNSTEPHEWLTREKVFQQGGATCEHEGCKIHSVKRLSDNQVFTVGDDFLDKSGIRYIIQKFYISEWSGELLVSKSESVSYNINDISKPRPPIPVLLTPSEIEKIKTILNTTP